MTEFSKEADDTRVVIGFVALFAGLIGASVASWLLLGPVLTVLGWSCLFIWLGWRIL